MRLLFSALLALLLSPPVLWAGEDQLVLDQVEVAGISGFRAKWDKPLPGANVVDAVHRSALVRFPGAAAKLAERLRVGARIVKGEIVLEYDGCEISPEGYTVRVGMAEKAWTSNPPQWHVIGWALRRPWRSDPKNGPTFNASVNGVSFWAKYGARDPNEDRYETPFEPAELSQKNPVGRLDVTTALTGPGYGEQAGERLRRLEDCGFLLAKWETYDHRYRDQGDAYEWKVPTGGHGLRFKAPRLVVTFEAGDRAEVKVAPAMSVKPGGKPTASLPSAGEIRALAARLSFRKPEWMEDWEFQRAQELRKLGGSAVGEWAALLEKGDVAAYGKLVDSILTMPPRYWKGWGVQDDLLLWYCYREALPAYVQDHLRLYWTSWLMPGVATKDLFHPQSKEEAEYRKTTGDWRGRCSFFRDGYCYAVSTMNFNHTAAMGALLGGQIAGCPEAMADGRRALEHLPLRFWSFLDGTSQEMLDHYYYSITLSAQKMFADFGPTAMDRLMGRMILDRAVELLASCYHPHLHKIVASSGRARLSGVLVEQDGIYHALHALSRKGVLLHTDLPGRAMLHEMPVFGYDFPADRAALQSMQGRWAPAWATTLVDEKPLPYEVTASETTRGNYKPPLWQRTYLGHCYALASQDIKGGTVDVVAQWNHRADPAARMEDLGTLTLRYAVNRPNLTETHGGTMPYAGAVATFQHRNVAIVCTKPRTEPEATLNVAGPEGVRSLSTAIALWCYREPLDWEVYVDGEMVKTFPKSVRATQVITIRDGASYVGLIPLPATDLGRKDEVVIARGEPGVMGDRIGQKTICPALVIQSYNLQTDQPLAKESAKWSTICTAAYGGFVIELGDHTEFKDFAAFQEHLRAARLETRWEADKKTLHLKYASAKDVMEMGFCTDYAQGLNTAHFVVQPGQHTRALPYRRANGKWPYPEAGIERDTTFSQQGTTGRLVKNGATLVTEKGCKAYLVADPVSGTYAGYNPFPDPVPFALAVPGGVTVQADGKVGLLRVVVRAKEKKVWVDYAVRDDQKTAAGMARSLRISGMNGNPEVTYNGKPIEAKGGVIGLTD